MRASTAAGGGPRSRPSRVHQRPFRIDAALRRIREAVRPLPKAAMFALAEEGYRGLFQQLVACILSIRSRDEVSLVAARRLFAAAPTPAALAALAALGASRIDGLIRDTTFRTAKAEQIREIAQVTVERYGGELPCDDAVLGSFRGVGPKCAHLALGIACGTARISVDIHVHRVVNRWGYVRTGRRRRRWRRWRRGCRRATGSRSTPCWCRSGSTSAPGGCRSARPVRCWTCAGRWG